MNKLLTLLMSLFFFLSLGCQEGLLFISMGDDDVADDDDDDITDDDDDDVVDDDDDTGDDDTEELCCSDCEYPAFVFDELSLSTMLEEQLYNEFLNDLLVDALPPDAEEVILLFDPDGDVEGQDMFDAAFGVGIATEDLWSWDQGGNPANLTYLLDGQGNFISTDPDLTLQLAFGVTVPLRNAHIAGRFDQDFQGINNGAITGAIREADTEGIETSFGNLHELMDGRPLDVDTTGDNQPDAWSFELNFGAFQFL